ncbi:GNAT family N-acetyltransferase [Micromonospora chokoriensis]
MTSAHTVDIRHDPIHKKYDAWHEGETIGLLVYEHIAGRIIVTHAAVEPEHRGNGIGTKLIAYALDDIRTTGEPVSVTCPVVRAFIERNPQYASLVAPS